MTSTIHSSIESTQHTTVSRSLNAHTTCDGAEPIRVLLAEDQNLLRAMLVEFLRTQPDIEVVAAVVDGDQALAAAREHRPQVCVFDIQMPGRSVFDVAHSLRTELPDARVLFLTGMVADQYIDAAMKVRAAGFLSKSEPPELVADAIRKVASRSRCFSPEVQRRIAGGADGADNAHSRAARLSRRELEVLQYISRGLTNKEIAAAMELSVRTVDRHISRAMQRLDLHDRVSLARYALREGLVTP